MRLAILAILLPTWAAAWEFSPVPLCTLAHGNTEGEVVITHDPGIGEYRMRLDRNDGEWVRSQSFGIAFRGGRELTIGTDRHQIQGSALSVADSGFDNVLYGLEFNRVAIAFTSEQSVRLLLNGAAPEVQKFRDCVKIGPPLS